MNGKYYYWFRIEEKHRKEVARQAIVNTATAIIYTVAVVMFAMAFVRSCIGSMQ